MTLTLSYPELNDIAKEELDEKLNDLPESTKKLFILFIKLFNSSIYNGDKEEVIICEKFNNFIENDYFIKAVENKYDKDMLLKDTNQEEDKKILENYMKIKKDLNILSNAQIECCKESDDIVKDYYKI